MFNRYFIPLLGTVVLLASGAGVAAAQENSPQGGTWALQFGISNNLTLANFDQAGVALKRHFSPALALRAGFRFSRVGSERALEPDTLGTRREADAHDVQVALDCMWYPRPKTDVGFFMGAGPLFRLGSADSRSTPPTGQANTQESSIWSVGGNAFLGVEWFVHQNLGIHAEYGVTGIYTSRETSDSLAGTFTDVRSDWSIAFDSVVFGLSVYF